MNQLPTVESDSLHEKNEVDLFELIGVLWRNKKVIFLITLLFSIFSITYSLLSPKQYKATASFFITSSDKPSGALSGYAAILGVNTPSNIENLVKNVLNSYSIKETIAQKFQPSYETLINQHISSNKLKNIPSHITNFVINELKLEEHLSFSVNKDNLFQLTYIASNKNLSKDVLDEYLSQILYYNSKLTLSAEKNIITIIDYPRVPIQHFKPNILLNIVLSLFLGIFISCTSILIKEFFK